MTERVPSTAAEQVAPAPAPAPAARTPAPVTSNASVQRLAHSSAPIGFLAAGGNRAFGRWQSKLTVSQPGDRFEVQADRVAEQVSLGEAPATGGPAISRLGAPSAAPGEGPPGLESLLANPGPGAPIPPDIRAAIEPHLGAALGDVQVHSNDAAQAAAVQLGARAFTSGGHIFLGPGESATDLPLMAHEATHVVQQQAVSVFRLQRESDSLLPDFIMDGVRDLARAVPGYDMLTVVAGYDPIANRTVARNPENLVRAVIGLVPFGNIVASKLLELGVLQAAFQMIDAGLTAHNLTLDRIQREIDQAWNELSIDKGIDGNVEVITRHVSGLYHDVLAFVRGIADQVVQLIRDAAVGLAEQYLVGTPVWELTKKVLHHDPLRGTPVNAPTVEILADFMTLIGKDQALAQMRERGTLQQTADWLDAHVSQFLSLIGELFALFEAGWAAIQPENLANLGDNLGKLARDATGLVQRVGAFAAEVLTTVVRLIKDALLDWLSREAQGMRGFRLMTVILGQDPFTGKAVPRSAENLIGGFIALLPGGEETYAKLAEAGVIADAAAQIEGAMSRLGISLDLVTNTFLGIWNSLSLEDLLNPLGAFARILQQFGEPLGRIVEFAGEVLKVVITLILKLMNFPSELVGSIISNAMAAIDDIQRDPVGFFINMIEALKSGFSRFFDKVLDHLMQGLADWLFRGLGAMGIQKPPDLSFKSILELVLQVLDVSVDKLWGKLGKHIGEDVVAKIRSGIDMASDAFDFIKDVQENGVAAIWKHVESQLGNLWDTLLTMAKDWIVTTIIEKAIAKVLSMLDPTGIMAVVNSAIAFFKAVQSVIEYVREILGIVNDYVSTLAAVAAGNIAAGATKIEQGLANAVPVAIGFLANQAGLGNVPEKLVEIITGLRELIDQALDWLFAQAVRLGKAALKALGFGGKDDDPEAPPGGADVSIVPEGKTSFAMHGEAHALWFELVGGKHQLFMASSPARLRGRIDQALKDPAFPAEGRDTLTHMGASMGQLEAEIAEQEGLYGQASNKGMSLNSQFFGGAALDQAGYRAKVTAQVASWQSFLEGIGAQYNLKDLSDLGHRSKFVEGDSIAAAFRGGWRELFYGGWNSGVEEFYRKPALAAGLDHWRGLNPGAPIPGDFDLYQCCDCGVWHSAWGAVPGFPVRVWSVDHIVPVARHFQASGIRMTQDERRAWYNDKSNLQGMMCSGCNHDVDRVTSWKVSRRFRGEADPGPDPSDDD